MSYFHRQPKSTIVLFITLRQYGYVCHIVCSSYQAMFVTLWQYGYVRQSDMVGLCLSHCEDTIFTSHYDQWIFASHCDDEVMFNTLRWKDIVCHMLTTTRILWWWGYVHCIAVIWHLNKKRLCDEHKCCMFIVNQSQP